MPAIRKHIAIIMAVSATASMYAQPIFAATSTQTAATVKELALSKTTVKVKIAKTKKVTAQGKYKKIKAKVSNTNTASATVKGMTVKIMGLTAGKTKVTVKAYNKKGKLKAKAKITVKVSSIDAAVEYAPDSVHTGEATYYDPGDSLGMANLDDSNGKYLTAAMNREDYLNGLAGAYIQVTDKDGDKVKVLINDMLPEGKKGDIDLSKKAFKKIEPLPTGRMKISWKVIALPTDDPVSFLWKTTSSDYWAEVQIRNNRYPVKSVEYYDTKKKEYVTMEKKTYNYFSAVDGMGSKGPFNFRITDIYGRQIVEKGIKMKLTGKAVKGENNFDKL